MAQPHYLNDTECPYGFRQDTGMTDWNTFLTNINTELVTNRLWTTPTTNLYKSPPDAGGRFIDILFTRISATNLEIRVRDQNTRTLMTRRIQLDAGGTTINYYTGKYYCIIDSLRATSEVMQAFITEMTPDRVSDIVCATAFCTALRSAADASDGSGDSVGDYFAWEDSVAGLRATRHAPICQIGSGTTCVFRMGSGTLLNEPMKLSTVVGGAVVYAGQPYHMSLVDSSIGLQTDKTLAVDDAGATGTFRVIGLATSTNHRFAVRKP